MQYAIFAYPKIKRTGDNRGEGREAMYRRLRDIREDRDLPQRALAELLHVSQATYSRYESGTLDIPSGALIALARFYGTSIDYLVGLTDDPRPHRS